MYVCTYITLHAQPAFLFAYGCLSTAASERKDAGGSVVYCPVYSGPRFGEQSNVISKIYIRQAPEFVYTIPLGSIYSSGFYIDPEVMIW